MIALYEESAILEENPCSLHIVDVLPSRDGLKRYTITMLLFSEELVFLNQTISKSVLFILLCPNHLQIANYNQTLSLLS